MGQAGGAASAAALVMASKLFKARRKRGGQGLPSTQAFVSNLRQLGGQIHSMQPKYKKDIPQFGGGIAERIMSSVGMGDNPTALAATKRKIQALVKRIASGRAGNAARGMSAWATRMAKM